MANEKLTITLTGRRPVTIRKSNWPMLAAANARDWDGEHESQAFRRWWWYLNVRQHADGRAIVYGAYEHETAWQSERDHRTRGGEMVEAGGDIESAIQRVGRWMRDNSPGGGERFEELIRECLANLPAEQL